MKKPMATRNKPEPPEAWWETLTSFLSYDPVSGHFRWKVSAGHRKAGDIAGCKTASGYWQLQFKKKNYAGHRLAWFYMTKQWPDNQVDHIDRNPLNNSWANLRQLTPSDNSHNTKAVGFYFNTERNKYHAQICVKGKKYHVGYFDCPDLAREAYLAAKERMTAIKAEELRGAI